MAKFEVLFENSKGQKRVIGTAEEECEKLDITYNFPKCNEIIKNFLAQYPHFKWYYTRKWICPDGYMCLDVGSHTEFFYIRVAENEEKEK